MKKSSIFLSLLFLHVTLFSQDLYFIDAHSQIDDKAKGLNQVLKRMHENNVKATLLTTRGSRDWREVIEWSKEYPKQIIPLMRTKGGDYQSSSFKYFERMDEQNRYGAFRGISETLLFHNKKGNKAPLIRVHIDDERFQKVLEIDLKKGWPVVLHIEFASLSKSEREVYMQDMEHLLKKYPHHPFVLIHMGQLEHKDVKKLIQKHKNIYFMTSHSDPITVDNSGQPWINLFENKEFKEVWRELFSRYPDRFIFALDCVWANDWRQRYSQKIGYWKRALSHLDTKAANMIAHENAKRLWKLDVE